MIDEKIFLLGILIFQQQNFEVMNGLLGFLHHILEDLLL